VLKISTSYWFDHCLGEKVHHQNFVHKDVSKYDLMLVNWTAWLELTQHLGALQDQPNWYKRCH